MRLSRIPCAALIILAVALPVRAEGIPWRTDYNAALHEARQRGRPLFLDVGTANCFWCARLEGDTLCDPTVVRVLSEQFIPVKIDAHHMPGLIRDLGIDSYPTLVFASPQGQLLGKHAGYVDAAKLRQQLQRALNESAPVAAAQTRTTAAPTAAPPKAGDLKAASDRLASDLCDVYLQLAEDALRLGQPDDARRWLERVTWLGRPAQVQAARENLAQMQAREPRARAQSPR